ncbi:MAG: hypothetical protein ACLPYS_10520, partial [Vulcanimicrobiaceae bacterium]
LTAELRSRWGATFPQYGLNVAPRIASKALREHPGAVKRYLGARRAVNEYVTEPETGTELDIGGPLEEGLTLANPASAFDYMLSPSRVGPISLGYQYKDLPPATKRNPHPALSFAERAALNYTPGGSIAGELIPGVYSAPGKVPPLASGAASLFGMHFTPHDVKVRRAQLQRAGVTGAAAARQLQREGYLPSAPASNSLFPEPLGATSSAVSGLVK